MTLSFFSLNVLSLSFRTCIFFFSSQVKVRTANAEIADLENVEESQSADIHILVRTNYPIMSNQHMNNVF